MRGWRQGEGDSDTIGVVKMSARKVRSPRDCYNYLCSGRSKVEEQGAQIESRKDRRNVG